MRTKTLLLTAALGVAGVATSMAQVYSQNIVGYVNIDLQPGFNVIANQLNASGSTGNTLDTVLPSVPDGTTLLKWDAGAGQYSDPETFVDGVGWFDGQGNNPSPTTLNPGEAAFLNVPSSTTITLVGEVSLQQETVPMVAGFSLVSIAVPQSTGLDDANLSFPAADGDGVLFWDAGSQVFQDQYTYVDGVGWFDPQGGNNPPTPKVGEGFFVNKAAAVDWVRTFSPN